MIGRHRVADPDEAAGAGEVLDDSGLAWHAVEVRWASHVRRVGIPLEEVALRNRQLAPRRITGEDIRVRAREHLAAHCARDRLLDLLGARPQITQIDIVSVAVLPERLLDEVDVHASRERIRNDERRRGEVVRLHLGMDPRLEVPVTGEHGAHDEVALGDRVRDRLR